MCWTSSLTSSLDKIKGALCTLIFVRFLEGKLTEDRIRRYYRPRVVIGIDSVLTPEFDGLLVCLEPEHLAILRPLLQYAHRKTTFADVYDDEYYLIPDDDQWDSIQAIVAELEYTLMGCTDIVLALQDIAAQLACVCSSTQQSLDNGQWGPTLTPVVEDYLDDGVLVPEDANGPTVPIDSERCALAQLTWAFAWEMITEVVQPAQGAAVDVLLPLAMVALGIMIGGPVVGVPAAVIVGILWYLAEIAAEGQMADLQNELDASKEELVCAVYRGLETDYRTAEAAARDVIESMESASPMDKVVLRLMFAPFAIKLSQTAWTAGTTWATSNVETDYCLVCEEYGLPFEYIVTFPPCNPSGWTGDWDCTGDGEMAMNGSHYAFSPTWAVDGSVNWDVELECRWRSRFPSGWTVGSMRLEQWNGVDDWDVIFGTNADLTTSQAAGQLNTRIDLSEDVVVSSEPIRMRVAGQAGQGDTSPWPMEIEYLRVSIVEAV